MSEDRREKLENTEDALTGIASNPQFSDMLNKVMSNPQIISAVASALSGGAKEAESVSVSAKPPEPAAELGKDIQDKIPEVVNMLKPLVSSGGVDSKHTDNRSYLLSAIKPYVSKQRADAIDYMIKFSKLSEILKGMN